MAQDKISILGPRHDGTYVVEFKTAAGKKLAITVPEGKTAVLKEFQLATAELHAPTPDEGVMISLMSHMRRREFITLLGGAAARGRLRACATFQP